jgi:hypothetical protein
MGGTAMLMVELSGSGVIPLSGRCDKRTAADSGGARQIRRHSGSCCEGPARAHSQTFYGDSEAAADEQC